jgi:cardiolipin synthase A/B
MKQKIITFFLFLLLFSWLSFFYAPEYISFYTSQKSEIDAQKKIEEQLKNFSPLSLPIVSETTLYTTPSTEFLDTLVGLFDSAQREILVEVYIFTEKRSREALIKAKKRGVKVQVLLEKNPYMAPNLNNATFEEFQKNAIDVAWSDTQDFALNHAKFYIIDDVFLLSSGNLSYSTFTKNRDFFILSREREKVSFAQKIFSADFVWEEKTFFDPHILLSPVDARSKITKLVSSAEKSIDMYFQYLSDPELEEVLILQRKKWVDIRIILDKDYFKKEPDHIKKLQKLWFQIVAYDGTTMHGKGILVDSKALYIGSVNFSTYSFDENREMGIILTNPEVISVFQKVFSWDIFPR